MIKKFISATILGAATIASAQSNPQPETNEQWEKKHIVQLKQTQTKVKARILKDVDIVEMAMGELALPGDETKPVIKELQNVAKYAETIPYPSKLKGFRAIIPFYKEHAKVFRAWSMILRDKGLSGLAIWHISRFGQFPLFASPTKAVSEISLKMMRNERRSQAVNITNCTKNQQLVNVSLSNIPEGAKISLFYTVYVDRKKIIADPSALLPAKKTDKGWEFLLQSGMTTQVWFMVDSEKVKAGKYAIPIKISTGNILKNVTFNLNVAPVYFPEKRKHNLAMFDYAGSLGRAVVASNQKAAIKDMQDHLVTRFLMSKGSLPSMERQNFDDKGNLTTKPDLSSFKNTIALLPKDTRYYAYFMNLEKSGGNFGFAGFPHGSQEGNNAFIQWLKYLENACDEISIDPKKIMLMPYDEPRKNDALKAVYKCLKIIKENTKFTTYCTTGARGAKNEYCAKSIEYTDVVQPCRRHVAELFGNRKKIFLDLAKQKDKELWLYDCGYKSSPLFYIKGSWRDVLWGATGTSWWAYCDAGDNPSNWNMYPEFRRKRDNYAPQYIDENGVTSSREWEAIMEGVENCEYMHMLRKKNPDSPLLKSKVPETTAQSEELRLKVLNELEK